MLSKASTETLNSLGSLTKTFQEFSDKLKDPAVQKRFEGNVFLLMGYHRIHATKLAKLAGCSQSTLSRLLKGTHKFDKTSPLKFASIALTLGVDANTLLFVDLREKFSKLLAELNSKK